MNKLEIHSVMHPTPFTISPAQTLQLAKEKMAEHNVRHLPVQEGAQLQGVLTDRDINFALAVEKKDADQMLVRDAFTAEPYIVLPETPVHEVAKRMAHDHLGCALIVENNHLLGIFTMVDAARLLGELLSGSLEQ